jgi:hypothetical protein
MLGEDPKLCLNSQTILDHMEDSKVNPCEMRCICIHKRLRHIPKFEGHDREELRGVFLGRADRRKLNSLDVPRMNQGDSDHAKVWSLWSLGTSRIEKEKDRNSRLNKEVKVGPIGIGPKGVKSCDEDRRHCDANEASL